MKHSLLAAKATAHCLAGCGTGEVLGIIIGTALAWSTVQTIILALILGAVFGMAFGIIPLLRSGLAFGAAFKATLATDGASIVVMETAQVLTEIYTPGVMDAGLGDMLFWLGMGFALIMGFMFAYPVNYFLIGKGIGHKHH